MPAVVIVNAQGMAVSFADSPADVARPLPDGLRAVTIPALPGPTQRWDAKAGAVVDVPADERPVDRRAEARRVADDPAATVEQLLRAVARAL